MYLCLFCGGNADEPDHLYRCDGRQGRIDAEPVRPFRGAPQFDGHAYEPAQDHARLTGQILRVYDLMHDGAWRTVEEIAAAIGDPQTSISAQLRNLRKKRFGHHTIERRSRGERSHGLWEYRLIAATREQGAA